MLYNGAADTTVNGKKVRIGLYTDAQGTTPVTKTVGEGEDATTENVTGEITLGADGTGSVTFRELEFGTYYVFELDDEGNAVTGINSIAYTVSQDKTNVILTRTSKTGNVTVTNSQTHFYINKTQVGDNSKEVEDAKIEIFAADESGKPIGNALDSWISKKDKTHDFGHVLETGKSYVLVETVAPKGYGYDTNILITVDDNGVITSSKAATTDKDGNEVYLVEDSLIDFHVKKTDLGGNELEGAVITIYDEEGKVVDTWESSGKAGEEHDFGAKLEAGKTYKLKEDGAPAGYKFANEVTITINNDGTVDYESEDLIYNDETKVYELKDEALEVKVSKVDATSQKELEGAHIQVIDKETKKVVDEWDSTTKAHNVTNVEAGKTYILRETVAPTGYGITVDTEFTIAKDGTVTGKKNDSGVLLVEDTLIDFHLKKTDAGTGAELEGAKITIYDENNKVVHSWTSKKGVTEDFGKYLEAGKTYTLKEDGAPAGYKFANDVKISIAKNGKVTFSGDSLKKLEDGSYALLDEALTVKVSKVDATNQKELEGAHIVVLDKNGNVVDEWVSTKTPHIVTNVKPGETYTLRETVAPNGYSVTTDTTFKIDEKGNVTYSGTTSKDGVLLVEDNLAPKGLGAVRVTKYTLKNNGAFKVVNQTFYTALFSDSGLTKRVSDIKPIVLQNAYTNEVTFNGLAYGTYYVGETDQNGTPMTSSSQVSKVEISNGACTLSSANQTANAIIKNTMKEGVLGAYVQVDLNIQKNVVDAKGKAKKVKDTFYFAVFSDANFTNRIPGTSIISISLKNQSSGAAKFRNLPYTDQIYVAEVDKSGNVIGGTKGFGYTVSYSANGLAYGRADGGTVTVINKANGGKAGVNRNGNGNVAGTDRGTAPAVRTGDQTPILPMMITMLIAAAAAIFLVFLRRRMKKQR